MPDFTVLARTPYPGPGWPAGNTSRVAVTFRLAGDVAAHTLWLPGADPTDEQIALAVDAWIAAHPT